MSTGNSRDDDEPKQKRSQDSDPAYQGAKPGSIAANVWGAAAFLGHEPGVSDAMSAVLAQNWWVIALRGACAILFGIIAVLLPGVTLAALVLLFSAYMLVDGVLAIIAGLRAARRHERWGWLIVEGIADLAAGAIAFLWPLATVLAFVLLLAAWAIVTGVLLLNATFRLPATHGKWLMGFGALVSLVWGVLLIFEPIIGAVVLTWWMGGYALFFGGALLVLAFRLRRRRHEHRLAEFLPQRP